MIALFYFLIVLMVSLSGPLYNSTRKENIKDGSRLLIKLISLILTIYMTVFQIPFFHVLLQGFLCEEDSQLEYSLPTLLCDDITHKIMIFTSSFTLLVYILFLLLHLILFNSNSFDSEVPWSQFEHKLGHLKMIIRFILVACLVFEKSGGDTHAIVHLATGGMMLYVIFKRIWEATIFDRSIYYA